MSKTFIFPFNRAYLIFGWLCFLFTFHSLQGLQHSAGHLRIWEKSFLGNHKFYSCLIYLLQSQATTILEIQMICVCQVSDISSQCYQIVICRVQPCLSINLSGYKLFNLLPCSSVLSSNNQTFQMDGEIICLAVVNSSEGKFGALYGILLLKPYTSC